MARRKTPLRKRAGPGGSADVGLPALQAVPTQGATTGRYLVLFKDGAGPSGMKNLSRAVSLKFASTADFEGGAATAEAIRGADGLLFPDLGCAVVDVPPEQLNAATVAGAGDILAIEPERVVYAIDEMPNAPLPIVSASSGLPLDYFRGYRDAVNHLCDKILGISPDLAAEGLAQLVSETELTWGLQATKVPASRFTGKGIRVAVLDTGIDVRHPDFNGRNITTQSFV